MDRCELISTNNDYKIIVDKKHSMFNVKYKDYCNMSIFNSMNNIVSDLVLTKIDIMNIIDNIYQFLEFSTDIIYPLSTYNQYMETILLRFSIDSYKPNEYEETKYKECMSVLKYSNEYTVPVVTVELTDRFDRLIQILYYTFLVDEDDTFSKMISGYIEPYIGE